MPTASRTPARVIPGSFNLPFAEQIEFFRQKVNLPTKKWDDIRHADHDRSFVVAGAMKADLLDDLRTAVDKAIANGTGLKEFRKDFWKTVNEKGWHGWTGEGTKSGEAWRTKVIWETNLRTSYMAGRHAQLTDPDLLKIAPYWRYVHSESVLHPRPEHLAWNGLVLPHDHPFWQTHFPPNGWGCQCRVVAETKPKDGDKTTPPEGWNVLSDKTGNPPGIDKGWAYAPGKSVAEELREIVAEKITALPAELGAELGASVIPLISEPLKQTARRFVQETLAAGQEKGNQVLMHVISQETVGALIRMEKPLETSGVWLTDERLLHSRRNSKDGRGAALPASTWENLPDHLAYAKAYYDTVDDKLVYVFETAATPDGKTEKVAIAVGWNEKARLFGKAGKAKHVRGNFIRTGGYVKPADIEKNKRYQPLDKKE